jgi:multisubunit Na+/H+ antiporter MnhC subunit
MMTDITLLAVLVLFSLGLVGTIFFRNRLKRVMALLFMQCSVVLLFVSLGYRPGSRPPLFTLTAERGPMALPSAQAMATSILVLSAVTVAFLLALALLLPWQEDPVQAQRSGRRH